MSEQPMDFSTLAIHAGTKPDPTTGARVTPIYQTNSYIFENSEHAADLFALRAFGNIYTRIMNPTQEVLEAKTAALEGGTAALATASGHGAQLLVFHALLSPGDEFVAARQLYGGSINQFNHAFKSFGWNVVWADVEDISSVEKAISPRTKAIFVESIANPGGLITDLEPIAQLAAQARVPLIVDNTLATPYLCRPIDHGANIVVHSATKFLGGHGNSMGGLIVDGGNFDWAQDEGKYPLLSQPNDSYHGVVLSENFGPMTFAVACRVLGLRDLGPSMAPQNAFYILTAMETLPLRMRKHCQNACKVAKWLSKDPRVSWVNYAGLKGHKHYHLHKKYCPKGCGSVFTFGLKGGHDAGVRTVSGVKLISHVANIGDTRSLIIHPASTTHSQLSPEQQKKAGASPDTVRLSIGIEAARDIIADLDQAMA